ncbi:glycosyltransferase family 2 protein [Vibrio nereis]|uniref:glycosyltransferase family 2 protein n=1 Tax=Vibrio nereis TaxID=693 RepID=UPI002494960D|nr:glycosyltransferase [Vibrio nereis]
MLKAIAKKAIDKRRKNKPIVNIDGVFEAPDMFSMSGWLVLKADIDPIDTFQLPQGKLITKTYPRQDVEQAIDIQPGYRCYGFVVASQHSGTVPKKITIAEKDVVLSEQDRASSIEETVSYLSEKEQQEVFSLSKQVNTQAGQCFFTIDELIKVGLNKLFIRGWCNDPFEQIAELVLSDGKTTTDNLYPQLARCSRPDLASVPQAKGADIDTIGFYCCISTEEFDAEQIKCTVTYTNGVSQTFSNIKAVASNEKIAFTKSVLSSCHIHSKNFLSDSQTHLLPLLSELWQKDTNSETDTIVHVYGDTPNNPTVSVIIPIYGRYDFIAHQISAFKQDATFENFEIIYVLDDPKIEREFDITANGVYQTYKQPFKTVFSGKNLGFSGANNLGVSVAKGQKVLLLNSDILPSSTGWLERLNHKFDQLEDVGILGTKLVYEDDTIQHLGMEFQEDAFHPGIWMNYHPHKGFPEALMESFGTKEVQAVTGACMLLEADFYRKIGGLDENYILGDFEDSDLCLKAHHHKKKIYLDDSEKLYHLERLSQNLVDAGDWKFKLTLINGTRQISKWNTLIKEVRSQYAE